MNTILIVCGAGASSTFVASRLRSVAAARGSSVRVEAGSADQLGDRLVPGDVVLVGAHLAASFPSLAAEADAVGASAALLPSNVLTADGPEVAFELATGLIRPAFSHNEPITEGHHHG